MNGELPSGQSLSIPAREYHADQVGVDPPTLSNSTAKVLLSRSPFHAWCKHPRLGGAPTDSTKVLDDGSAAHAVLFGEREKLFIVDADDWKTKLARTARDEARAADLIPVLKHQVAVFDEMAKVAREKVAACRELGYSLNDGDAETTLLWREPNGVYCKARLDWLSHDRKLILDYKMTGRSASPEAWQRQLFDMQYEIQDAFYRRAVEQVFAERPQFAFLVQEDEPKYSCSIISLTPVAVGYGEKQRQEAVRMWGDCIAANRWPAYSDRIAYIDVPPWRHQAWAERLMLSQWEEEEP